MKRRGFTLIEMLLATILSSLLMFAMLSMLAGISRDRRALRNLRAADTFGHAMELLTWDSTNARTFSQAADEHMLQFVGIGGIDSATMSPNGRLVRVTYMVVSENLWRVQEYLDTPNKNKDWRDLVATDVSGISVGQATEVMTSVPSHVQLRISGPHGGVDQEIWIK